MYQVSHVTHNRIIDPATRELHYKTTVAYTRAFGKAQRGTIESVSKHSFNSSYDGAMDRFGDMNDPRKRNRRSR